MDPHQLFKAGKLGEAVAAATQRVKADPLSIPERVLLFKLLCVQGELDRAEKQLDVLASQDPKLAMTARIHRLNLSSERERRAVDEGQGRPLLPPDPPPAAQYHLEAIAALRRGDSARARDLIDLAAQGRAPLSGRADGAPFRDLRDYDDFLGPILEIFAGGRCLWLPFDRVRRLEISPPKDLLDLIWIPAKLLDRDGKEAEVFLPALYGASGASSEEALKLGRETRWEEAGEGLFRGLGRKTLLLSKEGGEEDRALLDLRRIEIVPGGA